jgi:predicted PurR-regulated permease PerM
MMLLNYQHFYYFGVASLFLEFIPIVGQLIFIIIFGVYSYIMQVSVYKVIGFVLGYLIYQQLVNYVIYPKLAGKSLGVNPLLLIISIFVISSWLGPIGVILAVPINVIIIVIWENYKAKVV